MRPRSRLLPAAIALTSLFAACSSTSPGGPGPGSNPPGAACTEAADCGCWECRCQGVGGAPGYAQLCLSGTCPTGEAACAPSCAAAGAMVASAVSRTTCNGVP